MKVFLVKDLLNKEQLFYHNYYLLFILGFMAIPGIINFDFLYFGYAIPLLGIQFSQNFFNFFAHKLGYRMILILKMIVLIIFYYGPIWGDAWHNNHPTI